jgi:class 3 adenylate cyclase/tetratricopeptide (TPR) repeat protein
MDGTTCSVCAVELRAGARFCDACGHPVAASAPAPPDPATFTPEHIAEKIRASRQTVEGERKHITVLFADLVGSMDLAETLDPEDWRRLMERYFQILCDGVHRYEGTVDKFTGDGIMALFGAPIAHEDHARRACFAALQLREELARYSDELARERGLRFAVRIGLNSGEVVVGTIAEDLRVEYTAIGNPVGLAKRVEALAEPGQVCLTDQTASLVRGYFDLRDLGAFDVKGVSRPVAVWELKGRGSARTPLDVAAARGFSPFVGRDEEMAALEAALDRAQKGEGAVVGVMAEPGVGKSRLGHEFSERCRAQGLTVWKANALAHARAVPFVMALELLRGIFGIGDGDGDETARIKVVSRLLDLDPSFEEDLPLLLEFLGVPDPARPVERMDPEARRRQLFASGSRFLRAQSQQQTCVMLIEDLHWLDAASEALLDHLIEGASGIRLLLVGNYRPEYRAGWLTMEHCREIALTPLGPDATQQLLGELLGGDPSLDGLDEVILERTSGTPFFIEEVVRSLAEDGVLEGQHGAYRLARTLDQVRIPDSVRSVLEARIDRLQPPEKELLQLASVIGNVTSERLLRQVASVPDAELDATLGALVDGRFLDRTSESPQAEYTFRHPLTEEVAYRTQVGERRAREHRTVAQAIIELEADRLDERAALIAHHWEAAGELLEAANWSVRAAGWAGYNDQALATLHWRKVRSLAARLGPSPEATPLGITAAVMILALGWRLGGLSADGGRFFEDEAVEIYAEGCKLAESIGSGNEPMLAALAMGYATARGLTGHIDEFQLVLEAVDLADRSGDVDLRVAMRAGTTYPRFIAGYVADALRIAGEGIELTGGDPSVGAGIAYACPLAAMRMVRGLLLGCQGRLKEGFADLERALQAEREVEDPDVRGWAPGVGVWLAHWAGLEGEDVLTNARRCVELTERAGGGFSRALGYTFLTEAHLLRQAWDDALTAGTQALAVRHGSHIALESEAMDHTRIARAHLGAGRVADALSAAERGLSIARERGHRIAEVEAQTAFAQVLLAEGARDPARIRAELDQGLQLAERIGFLAYQPQIHLRLAELARATGDESTAAQEFDLAYRQFAAIGADGWLKNMAAAT